MKIFVYAPKLFKGGGETFRSWAKVTLTFVSLQHFPSVPLFELRQSANAKERASISPLFLSALVQNEHLLSLAALSWVTKYHAAAFASTYFQVGTSFARATMTRDFYSASFPPTEIEKEWLGKWLDDA